MNESWINVPGGHGYQVSNHGRFRSPRKVLKPTRRPTGHLVVWVKGYGLRYAHQFVLLAFVGPRPKGQVCMHLNHDPGDNRLTNLRYGSVSENICMDIAAGKRQHVCVKGERHPAALLSDEAVRTIRTSPASAKELAQILCVTPHHVRAIRRGATRSSPEQNHRQLKEKTMAKATKTLTKAEIKDAKLEIKTSLKAVNDTHGKFVSDFKAAEKALVAAKKEADKAIATAQKTVDGAAAKLEKATATADKVRAKLNAQLAGLEPQPETAAA